MHTCALAHRCTYDAIAHSNRCVFVHPASDLHPIARSNPFLSKSYYYENKKIGLQDKRNNLFIIEIRDWRSVTMICIYRAILRLCRIDRWQLMSWISIKWILLIIMNIISIFSTFRTKYWLNFIWATQKVIEPTFRRIFNLPLKVNIHIRVTNTFQNPKETYTPQLLLPFQPISRNKTLE